MLKKHQILSESEVSDVYNSNYPRTVSKKQMAFDYLKDMIIFKNNNKEKSVSYILKTIKNIMDKCFAISGIILSAPLIAISALTIKLTSKGPILFKQERLGLNKVPFTLIKFRTMIDKAEKDTGPKWSSKDDPRITKVGKFLRKSRLDELPQLFNVLRGDMSFVGPRPIRQHFADLLSKEIPNYSLRFKVKPGITGWAQVNADYAGSVESQKEKFEYDLYYILNKSIWLDLLIVLKTFKIVFLHRGQ